jgi:hypothetical protein
MISSRYANAVALLLALALVPTVIHSYLGLRLDDGLATEHISRQLHGYASVPANRNSRWGEDVFDSEDWIERTYKKAGSQDIRLFVARSYDHKRLYHHPELALSYGKVLKSDGIVVLSGRLEIPVRLLRGEADSELVAYTLLYGDEFVEDPIAHQISDSFYLLTSARKPMTLFYTSARMRSSMQKFDESAVASVLRAAIESFVDQNSVREDF